MTQAMGKAKIKEHTTITILALTVGIMMGCEKQSPANLICGEVAQVSEGGILVRIDSTTLIYYSTDKTYRLGDRVCNPVVNY